MMLLNCCLNKCEYCEDQGGEREARGERDIHIVYIKRKRGGGADSEAEDKASEENN